MSTEETTQIAKLTERVGNLAERLGSLEETLRRNHVTHAEFWPVRTLVYGFVALSMLGVVTAILALVIKS